MCVFLSVCVCACVFLSVSVRACVFLSACVCVRITLLLIGAVRSSSECVLWFRRPADRADGERSGPCQTGGTGVVSTEMFITSLGPGGGYKRRAIATDGGFASRQLTLEVTSCYGNIGIFVIYF